MRRPRGPAPWRDRVIVAEVGKTSWCGWWSRWGGLSPLFRSRLQADCTAEEWDEYLEESKAMKRPQVVVPSEEQQLARVEVPKLLLKLTNVAELLVQPAWDDGVGKGERAVFVFVSATLVKLLVKVSNPPLKMMVSGRSWDEAWAALEAVLRSEDQPWEQDGPRDEKGAKKKK